MSTKQFTRKAPNARSLDYERSDRAPIDRSDVFTNARDSARTRSQLTNGYLTPLSARL